MWKKSLLLLSLLLLLLFSYGRAEEPTEVKESKWKVTIDITWNEANRQKAMDLLRQILSNHEDACKVEVTVRKADNNVFVVRDSDTMWFGVQEQEEP